jgi:hypothetical protein
VCAVESLEAQLRTWQVVLAQLAVTCAMPASSKSLIFAAPSGPDVSSHPPHLPPSHAPGTPIETFEGKFANGTLAAVAEAAGVAAANISGKALAIPVPAAAAAASAGRRMLLQAAAAAAVPDGASGTVVTYNISAADAAAVRQSLSAALLGPGTPFYDILARNGVPLRPGVELDGKEIVAAGPLKLAESAPPPPPGRKSDPLSAAELTGIAISGGTSLVIVAILTVMLVRKYSKPRRYYTAKDIDPETVGQLRSRYSTPAPSWTATGGGYSKASSGSATATPVPLGGGSARRQYDEASDLAVGYKPYGLRGRDQDGGGYAWGPPPPQQQQQRAVHGAPTGSPDAARSPDGMLRAPPRAARASPGVPGGSEMAGLVGRGRYGEEGPSAAPGALRAVPLPPSPASRVHAVRFGSGLDFSTIPQSNYSVLGSSMPGSRLLTAERVRQQALKQHASGSPRAMAAAAASIGGAAAAAAAARFGRNNSGGMPGGSGTGASTPLLAAESISSHDSFTTAEIQAGIEALAHGDDTDSMSMSHSDAMVPISWQPTSDNAGAGSGAAAAERPCGSADDEAGRPWHRRLLGL